jgi:hypothetical protein
MKEVKAGFLMLLVCVALYVQAEPKIWSAFCQLARSLHDWMELAPLERLTRPAGERVGGSAKEAVDEPAASGRRIWAQLFR